MLGIFLRCKKKKEKKNPGVLLLVKKMVVCFFHALNPAKTILLYQMHTDIPFHTCWTSYKIL